MFRIAGRRRELLRFFGVVWGRNGERTIMARAKGYRDAAPQGVAATTVGIFREVVRLIGTEFRLLRAEIGEKIGVIGWGVGLAAGGAVLLIMGVVLLFVAAISALMDQGLGLTAATLIVFVVVLAAGAGCLWFGVRQLRMQNLLPNKTIAQVQKDIESIAPEPN
jgi:uncharacterized membrane protein YqjE